MNPLDPGPFVGHPANGPRRPFALSFPRDPHLRNAEGFDKLSPNGWLRRTHLPFVLSPSTGSGQALAKDSPQRRTEGFDKLSPNGSLRHTQPPFALSPSTG
jgi:hypothetical protein